MIRPTACRKTREEEKRANRKADICVLNERGWVDSYSTLGCLSYFLCFYDIGKSRLGKVGR